MPTFEATAAGYRNLWRTARVKDDKVPSSEVIAKTIIANRGRYQSASDKTGVPWFWIGCVHYRESSLSWTKSLAQGDPWDRASVHVPKGRGPFRSWEEAAVDALQLRNLHKVQSWPIERILYEFEGYNGFGYSARGVNSPYVWSGTTLQQPGKYIADGVWDSSVMDRQLGCACLLKSLCGLDASVADAVKGAALPPPPDIQKPDALAPQKSFIVELIKFVLSQIFRR